VGVHVSSDMDWFESATEYLAAWKERDAASNERNAAYKEFTPGALRGLELARSEADRLNRNYVGTEHVLLGLTILSPESPENLFRKLGMNLELIRSEVEKIAGTGREKNGPEGLPYTPRVRTVFESAKHDAKALDHFRVGPGHLLSGLLKESEGSTAAVFKSLKIDREEMRRRVLDEMKPASGKNEPTNGTGN
jgi:ATP-dependent Clp protease ATP-binding subunit ClpC